MTDHQLAAIGDAATTLSIQANSLETLDALTVGDMLQFPRDLDMHSTLCDAIVANIRKTAAELGELHKELCAEM